MKKIVSLLIISLFLLAGCGNVKLKDNNSIVSFKNEEGITAEELYEKLKSKDKASTLIEMIDTYLLNKEYSENDDEKKYINDAISYIKSAAKNAETDYETYISAYYGVSSNNDFKDYLRLNYRRSKWATDYAKTTVSEKQLNQYYENEVIGDIEASHILISVAATDDMTDDEKDNAKKEAYNKAVEIIKKLDNGEDFATLAKEYSSDSGTVNKGGYLGYFNKGEMTANFEEAAIKLEVGKYSSEPVETEYGYHIIYKTNQKEKEALEDIKDEIEEKIASEMLSSDSTLYAKSLIELRNKYEMSIVDSELKNGYDSQIGE